MSDGLPMISIIIPVYKAEGYINKCVDSVLKQTYSNIEIILVDDGSPDNSSEICDKYAKTDSRVKVIHSENKGPSAARNLGIDAASGKYLMFCDSDDFVSDSWCDELYNVMKKFPNSFITCDFFIVAEEQSDTIPIVADSDNAVIEDVSYFDLYKIGLSPYLVNKIFNLDTIKKHNIRFDENCSFSEDAKFTAEYCSHCDNCLLIKSKLYYYVQRNSSIMHTYKYNLFSLHIPAFLCRLPLLSNSNIQEYCDIWLYHFINLFDNIFDKRNPMKILQKLNYNQQMACSEEFQYCLEHASGANENEKLMRHLRNKNYYGYWITQKLYKIKRALLSKKNR